MAAIEVGRVCFLTRGRNAGKKVVIAEVHKDFVIIEGEEIKRKKCNILHLFPTAEKGEIKKREARKEEPEMNKKNERKKK